ncbi:MAG: prolipoprotein diacylglyceryl transferase [Bacteroidales bacterium]
MNYIVWNVDPVAFSLFGLEIRWYGILFASAFIAGYLLLGRMLKKEGESPLLVETLLWYVALAVIIGARLGHCLFYEPAYYLAHPIEILYIRDGGLASHGAAIAILIALFFAARKFKKNYLYILDRVVLVVALSGLFIRMGNLMNSEIYGNVTNLPWGFLFVQNGELLPKHPTQIYEALSYLGIFIGLLWYYISRQGKPTEGKMSAWFLIILFGMRFLIEYVKEPQELWEANYMLNMGQMLSIPFILVGIALLFYIRNKQLGKKEKILTKKE